ncbi:MAG: hypothetical protein P1U34_11975 [Coxiellaceae bacterium]|nr:hypothetical protein [Coxiellaceae bacterium]
MTGTSLAELKGKLEDYQLALTKAVDDMERRVTEDTINNPSFFSTRPPLIEPQEDTKKRLANYRAEIPLITSWLAIVVSAQEAGRLLESKQYDELDVFIHGGIQKLLEWVTLCSEEGPSFGILDQATEALMAATEKFFRPALSHGS